MRGRSDYFIAYPDEIADRLEQTKSKARFVSYGIAGLPKATTGYLLCNQAANENQFVKEANKVIVENLYAGETERLYKKYFSSELASEITTFYKSIVGKEDISVNQ